MLAQLAEAGIPADRVHIIVGTGTHGRIDEAAVAAKVGAFAMGRCRVSVHDDRGALARVGRTTRGTPVVANRAALDADLLIGIGGVYPQHTVGFGGGAKI